MIWHMYRVTLGSTLSSVLALAPPVTTEAPTSPPSAETPPVSPPPPRLTTVPRDTSPPPAPDRCRPNGRDVCRPLTIGGAVLIALGVAGVGAGAGLAAISDKTIEGEGGYLRSYRPAGVLLVGAAVLVLTTGAFLVADSVQRQRGPRERRSRRRSR